LLLNLPQLQFEKLNSPVESRPCPAQNARVIALAVDFTAMNSLNIGHAG
jgi:hypothetical protein